VVLGASRLHALKPTPAATALGEQIRRPTHSMPAQLLGTGTAVGGGEVVVINNGGW
jgi:hypothetical protein